MLSAEVRHITLCSGRWHNAVQSLMKPMDHEYQQLIIGLKNAESSAALLYPVGGTNEEPNPKPYGNVSRQ